MSAPQAMGQEKSNKGDLGGATPPIFYEQIRM